LRLRQKAEGTSQIRRDYPVLEGSTLPKIMAVRSLYERPSVVVWVAYGYIREAIA
jgi:hypothetical protein